MEHKSNFDGSLYRSEKTKKQKIYKGKKMQCNGCGFISSTEKCPEKCGTMHPYKKPF